MLLEELRDPGQLQSVGLDNLTRGLEKCSGSVFVWVWRVQIKRLVGGVGGCMENVAPVPILEVLSAY